jgi:hypothetical protein
MWPLVAVVRFARAVKPATPAGRPITTVLFTTDQPEAVGRPEKDGPSGKEADKGLAESWRPVRKGLYPAVSSAARYRGSCSLIRRAVAESEYPGWGGLSFGCAARRRSSLAVFMSKKIRAFTLGLDSAQSSTLSTNRGSSGS